MFVCSDCGNESLKWQWQCSFCKSWNTLKEFRESKASKKSNAQIKQLEKIDNKRKSEERIISSSSELNTVLWWWIVATSLILLSWEPGIWKSTLALWFAKWIKDKKIIYISWEETLNQISSRAQRMNIKNENVSILTESNFENIIKTVENIESDILIIDSVSVISSDEVNWSSGSINQIKHISEELMNFAKTRNTTILMIWHITKDWNLAGPKMLEHMVDQVLYFEGNKFDDIRILRSFKNRFWNTSEVALFKMKETWLEDIQNPGLEFITNTKENWIVGSSLSITMEWSRPLLVEIEALSTYTKFWYPKRSSRWIESSKLDMIIAVLWKYTSVKLDSYDVYINIARGLKIDEPAVDLAIIASIISSKIGIKIKRDTIFIWEISLTWKVKKVFNIEKRIKEASKLWIKNIIIPDIDLEIKDLNLIKIDKIWDLISKIEN